MAVTFPFEKVYSTLFGTIYRPAAWVEFWSKKTNNWIGIWMVVDTGADYSLLPGYMSEYIGIDRKKDCKKLSTYGVGGSENVYLLEKAKVKLGQWEIQAPIGFFEKDSVPPLLGRQGFMEKFATLFYNHKTFFSEKPEAI